MGDKKRLIFLVFIVVGIGAVAYTWYPRLFPKKAPVRRSAPIFEAPTLIEVPTEKPAPSAKGKPSTSPMAKAPPEAEKEAATKARPEAPTTAERGPERFGLEFPPFVTAAEANECERRLKQDGLTTFRAIRHMDDGLYAARVGPFPSAGKASEVMAEVKAKPGLPPSEQGTSGEFFFEDGPYNLREVIQRAMEIRGKGHGIRIVPVEGKAPIYRLRTTMRLDHAQASTLSGHYRELGCPNRIVASR